MFMDQWFPFFDVGKTPEEMDRVMGCMGRPLGLRSVPRGTLAIISGSSVSRRTSTPATSTQR
jgi:hypothetical protein